MKKLPDAPELLPVLESHLSDVIAMRDEELQYFQKLDTYFSAHDANDPDTVAMLLHFKDEWDVLSEKSAEVDRKEVVAIIEACKVLTI